MRVFGWLVLGVIVLVALILWGGYNSLVTADEDIRKQIGQVQNVLQRQADLIPNLVEVAKEMAGSENQTLRDVIAARQQVSALSKISPEQIANNPELMKQLATAMAGMGQAIVNVNALREAYPTLRQSKGYLALIAELTGSQNRVATERRTLQRNIADYNVKVRTFPTFLIANYAGFTTRNDYFQATEAAQNAPVVKFR